MESLPIINKSYDLYKGIININAKLQKRWKYGIGLSLENSLLECIELFIMAKHAPKALKAGYLIKAVAKLEVVSLKLRFTAPNEALLIEPVRNISVVATTEIALVCFFHPLCDRG